MFHLSNKVNFIAKTTNFLVINTSAKNHTYIKYISYMRGIHWVTNCNLIFSKQSSGICQSPGCPQRRCHLNYTKLYFGQVCNNFCYRACSNLYFVSISTDWLFLKALAYKLEATSLKVRNSHEIRPRGGMTLAQRCLFLSQVLYCRPTTFTESMF